MAGEITENARTVITHLAQLSVDKSAKLTADVHFSFFFIEWLWAIAKGL